MVAEAGAGIFGQQRDTLTKKKNEKIVVDSVLIPGGHRKRYLVVMSQPKSLLLGRVPGRRFGAADLPSTVLSPGWNNGRTVRPSHGPGGHRQAATVG